MASNVPTTVITETEHCTRLPVLNSMAPESRILCLTSSCWSFHHIKYYSYFAISSVEQETVLATVLNEVKPLRLNLLWSRRGRQILSVRGQRGKSSTSAGCAISVRTARSCHSSAEATTDDTGANWPCSRNTTRTDGGPHVAPPAGVCQPLLWKKANAEHSSPEAPTPDSLIFRSFDERHEPQVSREASWAASLHSERTEPGVEALSYEPHLSHSTCHVYGGT